LPYFGSLAEIFDGCKIRQCEVTSAARHTKREEAEECCTILLAAYSHLEKAFLQAYYCGKLWVINSILKLLEVE
jgi:hypothetical protein